MRLDTFNGLARLDEADLWTLNTGWDAGWDAGREMSRDAVQSAPPVSDTASAEAPLRQGVSFDSVLELSGDVDSVSGDIPLSTGFVYVRLFGATKLDVPSPGTLENFAFSLPALNNTLATSAGAADGFYDIVFGTTTGFTLTSPDGDVGTVALSVVSQTLYDGTDNAVSTGTGSEWVNLGAGDDTLIASTGYDVYVGGLGEDTLDYSASTEAVTINLVGSTNLISGSRFFANIGDQAYSTGGLADGHLIYDFELIIGSEFDDVFNASDAAAITTFRGGAGADTYNGGRSFEVVSYSDSAAGIVFDLATNTFAGDAALDTFSAIDGAVGTAFADTLIGDDTDNIFQGFGGADTVDGGGGTDSLDFRGASSSGITFDYDTLTVTGLDTAVSYTNIEHFFGTDFDDVFTASTNDIFSRGFAGDDVFNLSNATDFYVTGDAGSDRVDFSEQDAGLALSVFEESIVVFQDDVRLGDFDGVETVVLGGQDDTAELVDRIDALTLDAGAGTDRVLGSRNDDIIDLGAGTFTVERVSETTQSRILNFEDADGAGGDDTITGTAGQNVITGGAGSDTLLGDAARALPADGLEAQLYRSYQAVFDRAPDAAGFDFFLGTLRAGVFTQEQILSDFVGSQEFQDTYGELSNRAFVEQLYRNVLDREGDAGGVAAFTAELDAGNLSRAQVVLDFANSAEFIGATALGGAAFATNVALSTYEGQVFRAYQGVFGRDPDLGGFDIFISALEIGFLDLQGIIDDFVASPEFQSTYGSLDNRGFVELLYTNIQPDNTDEGGRTAFTAALDSGELSRSEVVLQFTESFAFQQETQADAIAFRNSVFTDSGDRLDGGSGRDDADDVMFGGRGEDVFVFDTVRGAADTILDFTVGVDRIDVSANDIFADFDAIIETAFQDGNDTVLEFDPSATLRLSNVSLDSLSADDFITAEPATAAAAAKPSTAPVSEVAPALDLHDARAEWDGLFWMLDADLML